MSQQNHWKCDLNIIALVQNETKETNLNFFFILQSFIKEVKGKVTADLKEEMSIMFNGLLSLVGGVLQVCRPQLKAEYLIN